MILEQNDNLEQEDDSHDDLFPLTFPPDEDEDEDEFTLIIPTNDFDIWLERYYDLKKKHPRFTKFEKHVVDVLESAKEDINPDDIEEHIITDKPNKIMNNCRIQIDSYGFFDTKKRVVGSVNGQNFYFKIQCPYCSSHKFTTGGSRKGKEDGDTKFKCKKCKKSYHFKPFVIRRYKERKVAIALNLIERGCSYNFVAKLLGVSPPTVKKWKLKFGNEVVILDDTLFDDFIACD